MCPIEGGETLRGEIEYGGRFVDKLTVILGHLLAFLSLGASSIFYLKLRRPLARVIAGPKIVGEALAPSVALLGVAGSGLGLALRTPSAVIAGLSGAALATGYLARVIAPHDAFDRAFGTGWQTRLPETSAQRMLRRRWRWWLPRTPEARVEREVTLGNVDGPTSPLYADIWQPPAEVSPSGLALVYVNSGGWSFSYPERWNAPLFRRLTTHGHIVMNLHARTWRESDLPGLVGDVKQALYWMKEHGERYGVLPEGVVLAGESAGGHLALLAAYAHRPELTPEGLQDEDLGVCGVIAYYPPTDLRLCHDYNRRWQQARNVLGGLPSEVPEVCARLSPLNYVTPESPPTLLFHGSHDSDVPVETTRALYRRLVEAGVPVVYVEFPLTEHAFDLPLPRLAPAGQAALYDVERFLALLAAGEIRDSEKGVRSC